MKVQKLVCNTFFLQAILRYMNTTNTGELKSAKLKFIALYAASIITIGIIMAAMWGPLPAVPKKNAASTAEVDSLKDNEVLTADKLLHSRFNELYNLDEQYNMVKANTNSNAANPLFEKIDIAEQSLQKTIDSLDNTKANFEFPSSQQKIASILASFKNALSNHKTAINSNSFIGTNPNNNQEDKQLVIQLKDDLQKKDERIKGLENNLKAGNLNAINTSPDIKLKQEIEFLSSSLRDQVNKNTKLTEANNLQKQNIDKLNKQIDAFRKFTGSQQ